MATPENAPMFDGCSKIVDNLVHNRPMFEGVDTASLEDMAFFAQNEIQERDKDWPPRPDLDAFRTEFEAATGTQPF